MAIDPSNIVLTPQMRQQLADLSERTGRLWSEMLAEFLAAQAPTKRKPVFGGGKGTAVIADDFDAPLPEFKEYME